MGGAAERPPDATVVVGPSGIIENVDDRACRLLGYSRAELVGLHGSELVPPIRKDGEEIAVEVSARPLLEGRIALDLRARRATESDRPS